jgi:mRNA interferase MazF
MQVTDWKDAGLLKPSTVKPVIATIQQSLVIRRLGRLKEADQAALKRALAAIVG